MPDETLIRQVLSLPVEDREELLERLQENLQHDPEAMPLSAEQGRELDRRYAESVARPDEGYTLEEVRAMLDRRKARGRGASAFGESLFEVLDEVRRKPTLYVSERSIEALKSFISGYLLARHEIDFRDADRWRAFADWIVARLRPETGAYDWAHLLRFRSPDTVTGFEYFFELLGEFRSLGK